MCSSFKVGALWCVLWLGYWQLWMLKRGHILASVCTESPQTSCLSQQMSALLLAHLVRTLWHPWALLDFFLHPGTLCCLLFLICYLQTKASFFPLLYHPEHPWISAGSLTTLLLYFHFNVFNFTPDLLLWFWAPMMLTCSSSSSFPPAGTVLGRASIHFLVPVPTWEPFPVFIVWLTHTPLKW